jgi:hypothetical protein
MTNKNVVALADALPLHDATADGVTPDHLPVLADFCASQDPGFNRERWIDYAVVGLMRCNPFNISAPDVPLELVSGRYALPAIPNVDDQELNRYIRSEILRKANYRVVEADGGRRALELCRSLKPELVLLDVNMPDVHGREICRRIQEGMRRRKIGHGGSYIRHRYRGPRSGARP